VRGIETNHLLRHDTMTDLYHQPYACHIPHMLAHDLDNCNTSCLNSPCVDKRESPFRGQGGGEGRREGDKERSMKEERRRIGKAEGGARKREERLRLDETTCVRERLTRADAGPASLNLCAIRASLPLYTYSRTRTNRASDLRPTSTLQGLTICCRGQGTK
jgi:hypothetical protein